MWKKKKGINSNSASSIWRSPNNIIGSDFFRKFAKCKISSFLTSKNITNLKSWFRLVNQVGWANSLKSYSATILRPCQTHTLFGMKSKLIVVGLVKKRCVQQGKDLLGMSRLACSLDYQLDACWIPLWWWVPYCFYDIGGGGYFYRECGVPLHYYYSSGTLVRVTSMDQIDLFKDFLYSIWITWYHITVNYLY